MLLTYRGVLSIHHLYSYLSFAWSPLSLVALLVCFIFLHKLSCVLWDFFCRMKCYRLLSARERDCYRWLEAIQFQNWVVFGNRAVGSNLSVCVPLILSLIENATSDFVSTVLFFESGTPLTEIVAALDVDDGSIGTSDSKCGTCRRCRCRRCWEECIDCVLTWDDDDDDDVCCKEGVVVLVGWNESGCGMPLSMKLLLVFLNPFICSRWIERKLVWWNVVANQNSECVSSWSSWYDLVVVVVVVVVCCMSTTLINLSIPKNT